MRKSLIAMAAAAMVCTGSAQAISLGAQVGEHYTEMNAGIGTQGSGLAFNGAWTRSDHNGQMGSLGATFGLPFGPVSAYVGGKALYLSPKDNKDGMALAAGAGLNWTVMPSLNIYGEAYGAPAGLTSGSDSYTETKVGARYTIFSPLSVDAGYRMIDVKGADHRPSNKIADGFYLGAGLSF
ncbi:YfaZ family outer membrane protein [Moellerella wisconsensis]|uniref:YfaZ family protein n=2 Tax=Moellerella wisconsensis TaxID=158849 RepID=A0ACD3Y557_9GAMM|nr:YfaZ family outer membrane protein [Moellerella wisconsensis]KLN95900.1 porin [Moellerella wisconsensis]UNH23165.1 YfaZ family protein [Moellerella wisconsensis]UNH26240.1 YfaZ family protein [Moellerella wisconsensis]UNH29659.1 YfaZ family protein [Moellerella wisconsensis]UNH37854.1 YfaZ family protein [Moellerella wisconsensis]